MDVSILAGLNEINAGWFEGHDLNILTEIAYALPTFMWALGQYWVPMLGSTIDPNGVAFNDRVTEAIDAIYNNTVSDEQNPLSDAVFAHAGTISIWTLMNVKNPDFGLVLSELLDTHSPLANTGQVVIEGNPTDGWTLVSWNGKPAWRGWAAKRPNRDANGLCLMLDAGSRDGVCAAKPPVAASP